MRRRRALALGAAVVGLAGCFGDRAGRGVWTPSSTPDRTDTQTNTRTEGTEAPGPTTQIGGSVHGRPYRVGDDLGLIETSETTWLHAFLDVRKKFDRDVTPREDPDVAALRRASRETGVKLYVSLQWNFIGIFGEQPSVRMPEPGSPRADALIGYATELLEAIDEPVELVGLGNEPVWETLDEDFQGPDTPLIPFTRDLKDYLVANYTADGPRYILGAFNRLFNSRIRADYLDFYRRLFDMARTDDDVDGIDLHIHYITLQQAETMLEVARMSFPEGTMTATEFSPVWRYDQHKWKPIGSFEGGQAFADRWGVPDDTTVAEYFEAAKYDRLSPDEMADFMETMDWYNVAFVEDMYDLLSAYDVELGTFGFLVEDDVKQLDWTEEWAPFPINCLFQPALIATEDGAHPHYLDDFQRRA